MFKSLLSQIRSLANKEAKKEVVGNPKEMSKLEVELDKISTISEDQILIEVRRIPPTP